MVVKIQYFEHTEICKLLKTIEAVWLRLKLTLPTHGLFWLSMELHSYRENFPYFWKVLEKHHKNSFTHFLSLVLQN